MVSAIASFNLRGQDKSLPHKPDLKSREHEHQEWVAATLRELSLEEKVGQLLQIRYYADYEESDGPEYRLLRDQIEKYHVGSLLFGLHSDRTGLIRPSPPNAAKVANQFQRDSMLPLLVAADLERGVATRLSDVPSFPWPMAFGAVGDAKDVEQFAAITAQEARAAGIQWAAAIPSSLPKCRVHVRYTANLAALTDSFSIRKNGARGGSRTHMRKNPRRILSPQRLPFRHPGTGSV